MQTTTGQEIELALKGYISVLEEKLRAGYTIPRYINFSYLSARDTGTTSQGQQLFYLQGVQ